MTGGGNEVKLVSNDDYNFGKRVDRRPWRGSSIAKVSDD